MKVDDSREDKADSGALQAILANGCLESPFFSRQKNFVIRRKKVNAAFVILDSLTSRKEL